MKQTMTAQRTVQSYHLAFISANSESFPAAKIMSSGTGIVLFPAA